MRNWRGRRASRLGKSAHPTCPTSSTDPTRARGRGADESAATANKPRATDPRTPRTSSHEAGRGQGEAGWSEPVQWALETRSLNLARLVLRVSRGWWPRLPPPCLSPLISSRPRQSREKLTVGSRHGCARARSSVRPLFVSRRGLRRRGGGGMREDEGAGPGSVAALAAAGSRRRVRPRSSLVEMCLVQARCALLDEEGRGNCSEGGSLRCTRGAARALARGKPAAAGGELLCLRFYSLSHTQSRGTDRSLYQHLRHHLQRSTNRSTVQGDHRTAPALIAPLSGLAQEGQLNSSRRFLRLSALEFNWRLASLSTFAASSSGLERPLRGAPLPFFSHSFARTSSPRGRLLKSVVPPLSLHASAHTSTARRGGPCSSWSAPNASRVSMLLVPSRRSMARGGLIDARTPLLPPTRLYLARSFSSASSTPPSRSIPHRPRLSVTRLNPILEEHARRPLVPLPLSRRPVLYVSFGQLHSLRRGTLTRSTRAAVLAVARSDPLNPPLHTGHLSRESALRPLSRSPRALLRARQVVPPSAGQVAAAREAHAWRKAVARLDRARAVVEEAGEEVTRRAERVRRAKGGVREAVVVEEEGQAVVCLPCSPPPPA